MKRAIAITTALMLFVWSTGYAATVSFGPVTTSATVDGALSLSVVLRENSSTGVTMPSIRFGALGNIGTGTLRSNTTTGVGSVVAMITVNSHGLQYTVTQTGTTMSTGGTTPKTLPAGACVVTPAYAAADNGGAGLPTGASVGAGGSFVSTGRILYISETAGSLRTIQAHYSITDDPAAGSTAGVPLDQAGGTYGGTVTITTTA